MTPVLFNLLYLGFLACFWIATMCMGLSGPPVLVIFLLLPVLGLAAVIAACIDIFPGQIFLQLSHRWWHLPVHAAALVTAILSVGAVVKFFTGGMERLF